MSMSVVVVVVVVIVVIIEKSFAAQPPAVLSLTKAKSSPIYAYSTYTYYTYILKGNGAENTELTPQTCTSQGLMSPMPCSRVHVSSHGN